MGHGGAADGPPVGRDAPAVSRVAVTLDLERWQDREVSAASALLPPRPALLLAGGPVLPALLLDTRQGARRPELRV